MISYQLFESGYCLQCERMTLKTGQIKQRQYPSTCALIKHPTQGYILFDTGYSEQFNQFTKKFPYSLYRYLTPVTLHRSLKDQLLEQEIQPTDIKYIVISHFHSDHIAGLNDFPNARFICHQEAYDDIKNKGRIRSLLQGFLPDLLPDDFKQRLILLGEDKVPLDSALSMFHHGYDLFSDKQLIAIDLPGHAKGHIGLFINAERQTFLIADSCWHEDTFKELIYPSNLSYLVHDNKKKYLETIQKLHFLYQQNNEIDIIPTHCLHSRQRVLGACL